LLDKKVSEGLILEADCSGRINHLIGIIFLPINSFYIKDQPFYLKNLCGLSILERNISILNKIGVRNVFIFSNDLEGLNNPIIFNKNELNNITTIKSLQNIKEYLNRKKKSNPGLKYAIVLDGGVLIDERIVSSLLNHEKEIVYTKGNKIYSNFSNKNQSNILLGKINLKNNAHIFQNNVHSFNDFFNSITLSKTSFHSSDEISIYKPDMRRDLPLYIYSFRDYKDFKVAKKYLIKRTQKGTLDSIAWYFNRHFENAFVYLIADTRITANHITILVNILGYIVFLLFFLQNWWISLILLSFINILDGVDGKLARLRNKESKVGHIEHSFDQLFEQAIYVGLGLGSYFVLGHFYIIFILIAMLLADSFNRHCSMQYKEVMKITLADSSRFDQLFRRFDGRRNIYTLHILIFGILGHFEYAIFSICIHAIITSIIYSIQAIRHMRKADRLQFK